MEYTTSESSSEDESITNYEERTPCDICGSDANDHLIMTCFNCRETREHVYCARVLYRTVPDKWICDECCTLIRVLFIKNGFANGPNQTARSRRLNRAYNRVSVASRTSRVRNALANPKGPMTRSRTKKLTEAIGGLLKNSGKQEEGLGRSLINQDTLTIIQATPPSD